MLCTHTGDFSGVHPSRPLNCVGLLRTVIGHTLLTDLNEYDTYLA